MKKHKRIGFLFFVLSIALAMASFSIPSSFAGNDYKYYPGGANTRVNDYYRPEGLPPYGSKGRFIGLLEGSWYEMGVQYGERAGDLIPYAFDGFYGSFKSKLEGTYPDQTNSWYVQHTLEDMMRYEMQLIDFWPRCLDMMKGIADGAGNQLDNSIYAGELNHAQMVLFINLFSSAVFRHPPDSAHFPVNLNDSASFPIPLIPLETTTASSGTANKVASEVVETALQLEEGCTGWLVLPSGTKDGKVIHAVNRETPHYPHMYQAVYVAEPSEPETNRFWSLSVAGGLLVCTAYNDKGLAVAHLSGAKKEGSGNFNFGVANFMRVLYAVVYSDTLAEAVEIQTLGTPAYRDATGRETLLRDGDSNTQIADNDSICVVESNAHWYAVRYPGDDYSHGEAPDPGEIGDQYLPVQAGYFTSTYSVDEKNHTHYNKPMNRFGGPGTGFSRFYAVEWDLRHNFGEITVPMVKEFTFVKDGPYYYCNAEGTRRDYKWDKDAGEWGEWVPVPKWSSKSGTNDAKVWVPEDLTIHWTKGKPCDWEGEWSRVEFK